MKKSLKIIFLVDTWFPFTGGGQIHVKNLTQKLIQDYNCQIYIYYPPSPHIAIRLLWSFLAPIHIFFKHFTSPPDIIHSHAYNSSLTSKILSILFQKPSIHTIHGSNLLDLKSTSFKAKLESILLTKITHTALITVSSTFLKHNNSNKNIIVIPNGVDLTLFDQTKLKKSKNPRIIWIGRDDPVKGYPCLQAALDLVKKQIPNLETDIILNGSFTPKQLIKKYKKAHLFVQSSISEGQPITLLEAWAAKLPVVVTSVGDNPQMVKSGKNGYLVKPKDPQELAEKIIKTLQHPTQAKSMGLNGYQLVQQEYTLDKITQLTFKLYQSVLKSN